MRYIGAPPVDRELSEFPGLLDPRKPELLLRLTAISVSHIIETLERVEHTKTGFNNLPIPKLKCRS